MRTYKRKERITQIRRRIFGFVAFIGAIGIVGTVGASDLNTISESQLLFQLGVSGLITVVGVKFSDIMKYRYDPDTGEEWYED